MEKTRDAEACWRIPKKWPRRIFWLLLGLGLLAAVLAPMYCDYPERARISEILVRLVDARERIARDLLAHPDQPVDPGVVALIPSRMSSHSREGEVITLAFREVTPQGEIRVYSPQLGIFLRLQPRIVDARVEWSCQGFREKDMPAFCRGGS